MLFNFFLNVKRTAIFIYLLACILPRSGQAQTYTVTNLLDAGPGSLRDALTFANTNAGADTIHFNITGTLPLTISPASALPTISDSLLVIDATSQPGYSLGSVILDGTSAGAWSVGLNLDEDADGSEIYGLWIRNFGYHGIQSYASNIIIGQAGKGNVITGNYHGILIGAHRSSGAVIQGNLVGVTIDSLTAEGNNRTGIYIAPFSGSIPGNFIIGGSRSAGEGNIIGGNGWANIATSSKTRIQGNLCGTNPDQTVAWPNGWNTVPGFNLNNIYIGRYADGSQVGGAAADRGNAIGFQAGSGIMIQYSNNILVRRNIIFGTNQITGSSWPGIRIHGTDSVFISRNSMQCNFEGIDHFLSGNQNHPQPVITTALSNTIIGTANVGDSIEVFAHDNTGCNWSTPACQGRVFLGGTRAVASGVWTINGTFSFSEITATATDLTTNRTSEFAICRPLNYVLPKQEESLSDITTEHTSLDLYPNPAQNSTCISAPATIYATGRYGVFSLEGKRLIEGDLDESGHACIDLKGLSPGMYKVLVQGKSRYQTLSFTKE